MSRDFWLAELEKGLVDSVARAIARGSLSLEEVVQEIERRIEGLKVEWAERDKNYDGSD